MLFIIYRGDKKQAVGEKLQACVAGFEGEDTMSWIKGISHQG